MLRNMTLMLRVANIMALALWSGGTVFFSFVAAPRIFSCLRDQVPRNPPLGVQGLTEEVGLQLAGEVVGAIFPTYFHAQIILATVVVATELALVWQARQVNKLSLACALVATAIVLAHTFAVFPYSTDLLRESYAARSAGDSVTAESLRRSFGMWHGVSQTLNLLTIALVLGALGTAVGCTRQGEGIGPNFPAI